MLGGDTFRRGQRRDDDFNGGSALDRHRRDPYAHTPLIARLQQENVTLRERFENRLSVVEQEKAPAESTDHRLGALERFRAQAVVLGGIGLVLLGAVAAVVAQNYFLLHPGH